MSAASLSWYDKSMSYDVFQKSTENRIHAAKG